MINCPRRQLQQWVDRLSFTGSKALTEIYCNILDQAARQGPEWLSQFHRVINPVSLLHFPLTIPAITGMLGEGDNMIVPETLKPLISAVEFPNGKELKADARATVRIYHESFRDFLADSNIKVRSQYWNVEGETHDVLLGRCIALLENKLRRNVCKRKDPGRSLSHSMHFPTACTLLITTSNLNNITHNHITQL
ncbi:hypothetical protein K470DRAFT_286722 [Piedraia hortae CBS 480.64]|uniref:Uncharacterized protein n=1 Tax=Piedraia hortae CBS 480.64 TaxID=1314780 RepID=A0A6A7BZQ9_9PEZI|nr:hypothetical protein K470DRAFT_286722 [Piedraia hortae CBS 480.64]